MTFGFNVIFILRTIRKIRILIINFMLGEQKEFNKFQERETKGRNKVREYAKELIGFNNFYFTIDMYDSADVVITDMFVLEIKDRDIPITDREGFMLEKIKWDRMCEQHGDIPKQIVMFFQDDYYALWDLERLKDTFDKRWTTGNFTKTTVENYCKGEVEKVYLDLSLAECEMVFQGHRMLHNNEITALMNKRNENTWMTQKSLLAELGLAL